MIAVVLTSVLMLAVAGVSAQAGSGGGVGPGGDSAKSSSGGDRYDRLWKGFSSKNRSWARRVSKCESGDRAKVHGGGGRYHGAFQFSLGTWRSSPKSPRGDPHKHRWRVQAVVAVLLKKRDGARHWPVCG